MVQIADKVFVVTGGGNGMGRQVVLGLARRGPTWPRPTLTN